MEHRIDHELDEVGEEDLAANEDILCRICKWPAAYVLDGFPCCDLCADHIMTVEGHNPEVVVLSNGQAALAEDLLHLTPVPEMCEECGERPVAGDMNGYHICIPCRDAYRERWTKQWDEYAIDF